MTDADRLRELEAANSDADQMIESISNELGEIIERQKAELAARDAELKRVRDAYGHEIADMSRRAKAQKDAHVHSTSDRNYWEGQIEAYRHMKICLEGLAKQADQTGGGR